VVAAALGCGPLAAAADAPVATVGTRSISRAELNEHVRPKLIELENERYEALRVGLDEMVADELLKQEANARNMTPEALEKQEIDAKVVAPTDAEIQKVYDDNKEQLKGQTLEQLKPRIIEYLKGIAPELIDRIKLYEDIVPLFDKANIEQEIRDLFKRRCDLPAGGYLIIEPTEALDHADNARDCAELGRDPRNMGSSGLIIVGDDHRVTADEMPIELG